MSVGPRAERVAGRYWSLHTHSRYSKDDALSKVSDLAERAFELDYPALGLTDHGNMAGTVQLYLAGKKLGLPVLPGIEMYMTSLAETRDRKAMHLTMAAYTGEGYRNLVGLNNQAQSQFFHRPRLDMADLAEAAEQGRTAGIALATGCRSGPVVRALIERGPGPAKQLVEALAGYFPRTYVELMDHDFRADGMWDHEIVEALISIADEVGIPTILTGDAHYAHIYEREAHDALKTLVSWSEDPDDGKFSGEGYWLRKHEELDPFQRGFEGLDDLAAAAKVKIPELDTFSVKIPDVTLRGEQDVALQLKVQACFERITADWPKARRVRAQARIDEELAVIAKSQMAGYILLVALICDFMEDQGIWFYARGSVAGSFVTYLLGISSIVNPLPEAWDIRMDRFLSGDRTSVPDIDLDIEHTRRDEVVAMLEARGYELVQVGTQPTYGLDKENSEDGEERGSLRVKYFGTARKKALLSGSDAKVDWFDVPEHDKRMLLDLADRGLISSVGAHPGGYVVAKDKPTVGCLPLVKIGSSGTVVTQFDKGEVEAMGFAKMDLLGSKVATALRICCTLIAGGAVDDVPRSRAEAEPAKAIFRGIPMDDGPTITRIARGKTTGMFQLGGWTNRKGLEQMRPKRTRDIVAAQALFRPAPMDSGFTDEYLHRRDGSRPVPAMHDDIKEELKETFGVALYQEQVVGLMRRVGLPPAQLTKMLKAVKSSGKAGEAAAKATVAAELDGIKEMARARGWAETDVDFLGTCLVQYGAGYSFGKAHAATYGVVGYITGYLAQHHTLEFWTGMLNAYMGSKNTRGEPLEPVYIRAARADEVRVKDPHVLKSNIGYTPDPANHAILRGLVSIGGVGKVCAAELVAKRPFESLVDLGQRVTGKVSGAKALIEGVHPVDAGGAVKALHEAHALDGIPQGTPVVKAPPGSRKRRCQPCKVTFPTPLELLEHQAEHHPEGATP